MFQGSVLFGLVSKFEDGSSIFYQNVDNFYKAKGLYTYISTHIRKMLSCNISSQRKKFYVTYTLIFMLYKFYLSRFLPNFKLYQIQIVYF
jgi:hypothetical protein